ncbi:MAG: hypothetical protein ABJH04_19605 [Cyclobacteriaceae bacterium]
MRKFLIVAFVFGMANLASAQSTSDIMIGGGLDFIKTDNPGLFEKSQIGFEVNYFVVRHFAVGLGGEIWSNQKNSFAMGARWYANDNVFLKFKGLIGANDVAIGGGYAKALTQYLRLEGMGDFYLNSTEFGVRIGLGYVIK